MEEHHRSAPFFWIMSDSFIQFRFQVGGHRKIRLLQKRVRDRFAWMDVVHRSHSPITKSNEPRIATTSLTICPGTNFGKMLKLTNEGARIFSRCGVPPPLLWM